MMSRGPVVHSLFEKAVHKPDSAIDLTLIALLLAKEEYPELSVDTYSGILDSYGKEIKSRISKRMDIYGKLEEINKFLFHELRYRGNREDYYNPENSYLNRVIDRRLGIPITLSLLYMEIGKRIGIPFQGIGLPGHFMIRYFNDDNEIFLDPFHQGNRLTREDCRKIVENRSSHPIPFSPKYLEPVFRKEILIRILRNLKNIYVKQNQFPKALEVVDKILLIDPDLTDELRDRGIIRYFLEQYSLALKDLRIYLKSAPVSGDTTEIRNYIQNILRYQAQFN